MLPCFYPRARGGRDYGWQGCTSRDGRFLSTRPRGARLWYVDLTQVLSRVSIHAPAGGATFGLVVGLDAAEVSIHAPAGGATNYTIRDGAVTGVSIHAPAGGATAWDSPRTTARRVSIHAPAGGATSKGYGAVLGNWFLSTRPRGARLLSILSRYSPTSFYPRARGGRDKS